MRIGVIIFVIASARPVLCVRLFVLYIGKVAEVAATELLEVQSARHIPACIPVTAGIDDAVGVLCEPFEAYEVRLLDELAVGIVEEQSELGEFRIGLQFAVISVSLGVM